MAFTLAPKFKRPSRQWLRPWSTRRPRRSATCARRPITEAIMARTAAAQLMPSDVTTTDYHTLAADSAQILRRWYVKDGAAPRAAVLYLHDCTLIS
jgi:hypothetical protein